MATFTAASITTLMLIAALTLGGFTTRSVCSSYAWQKEIERVASDIKTRSLQLPSLSRCSKSRVKWQFKGKLS